MEDTITSPRDATASMQSISRNVCSSVVRCVDESESRNPLSSNMFSDISVVSHLAIRQCLMIAAQTSRRDESELAKLAGRISRESHSGSALTSDGSSTNERYPAALLYLLETEKLTAIGGNLARAYPSSCACRNQLSNTESQDVCSRACWRPAILFFIARM
jgi:hypothetical protein